MSKMDRMLNSKKDKQTIYEIYRACRLCGAGAGYKMPIIQNVVDVDDTDVELKQKIRECVQIEVHQDDKMPPLICELCVDKVNDFYEFLEMCRQTNKRTRLRLGLPPQSMPKGAPDAGECILGLTEPVYVNDDSDGEPLAKQKKMQPKVKVKREPELKVKLENNLPGIRSSRFRSNRPPTPPRTTRQKNNKDDNVSLSRLQQDKSKSPKVTPKSILKKETRNDDSSLLTPRLKRSRDKEPVKLETSVKKVKIAVKSPPSTAKSSPKSSPRFSKSSKPSKPSPKRAPSPPPAKTYPCNICDHASKTPQANTNHMKSHGVGFTSPKLACNPCGLWFPSLDEATSHHKHHKSKSKPYTCRRCTADFKHLSAYDEHFDNNQCIPWQEEPDVKCEVCWHLFATKKLLEQHKCLGEDHRPGGKCSKCRRTYALLKNLNKHEQTCTAKKKGELIVDPVLLSKLKPIQVRMSRCDPLLTNIKQEHYDVSTVTADFGLDKNCVYPYISSVSSLRIKSEPELDGMVAIKEEIKQEFCTEDDYVHWDSESESESDSDTSNLIENSFAKKKRIDSLATLSLKTLFSKKCLGKVPKKRRKVKKELFDNVDTEDDVTKDINNIIDNLGDDDGFDDKTGDDGKRLDDSGDGKMNENSDVVDRSNEDCVDSGEKIVDITDSNTDAKGDVADITDIADGSREEQDNNKIDNEESSEIVDKKDITNSNVDQSDNTDSNVDINNDKRDDVKNDQIDGDVNVKKDDETETSDDLCVKDINNSKIDDSSVCNDTSGAISGNTKLLDNNITNNNGTINNISNNETDSSRNGNSKDNETPLDKDNDVSKESLTKNDCENSQDSNSVDTVHDSLLNDNIVNETENNEKCSNDNASSLSGVNEVKSQINESAIDHLSQDSENENTTQQENPEDDESKSKNNDASIENLSQESKTNDSNGNQTNDNLDSSCNDLNINMNNENKKNPIDSDDMEDSNLMAALDAEIGEPNDNLQENNDSFNDKIALEDLISSKTTEKPIGIDNIPDEFNFDG